MPFYLRASFLWGGKKFKGLKLFSRGFHFDKICSGRSGFRSALLRQFTLRFFSSVYFKSFCKSLLFSHSYFGGQMSLLIFFSLNFGHSVSCFLFCSRWVGQLSLFFASTFKFYHVASCFPVSNLFRGTRRRASFGKVFTKLVRLMFSFGSPRLTNRLQFDTTACGNLSVTSPGHRTLF